MILLFNVRITSQAYNHYHRAEWLPKYSRFDIFKYCISSYSAMKPLLKKTIFYIQLDEEFQHRKDELEQHIYKEFPDCTLHWYRNYYTRDWRKNYADIVNEDDDLVWFMGNDDHIFMDYNLDVLANGIDLLNAEPDPLAQLYFSHWLEQCRIAHEFNAELQPGGNYLKYHWRNYDGINMMKVERFRRYWFDFDFGELAMFRTDNMSWPDYQKCIGEGNLPGPIYAPTRELAHHYDGYGFLERYKGDTCNLYSWNIDNICPVLVIPDGFFENDIKIRIGYNDHKPGWVTLNPAAETLYTFRPWGVDYRWVEEDIPLFWRGRISEIEYAPDYDAEAMLKARDQAYLAITCQPMSMACYNMFLNAKWDTIPPQSWFKNHLRSKKNLLTIKPK